MSRKESDYEYPYPLGTGLFNEHGILRPDSYLRMFTEVADRHVRNFSANNAMLMERFGVAWVLLATEIHRLGELAQNEILQARTWCTGWRHGMYGRDMIFCNEKGEEAIGVGSLWTLLDVARREIYHGEEVPAAMELLEAEPRYPGKKARFKTKGYDLEEAGSRRMHASYLDASGHVNNARYGEFFYDALSEEMRGRLPEMERLAFYFHGEMSRGEEVLLRKWEGEREALVTGTKAGQECFVARLLLKEEAETPR